MSNKTNAAVVKQAYAAFVKQSFAAFYDHYIPDYDGYLPEFLSLLTDDVEWTLHGPSVLPWAGTRYGHEGVAEFFSLVGEWLEIEHFETGKFVAQGDTVVVLGYERSLVLLTGRTFEQEWAHVYTLRDGKIAKVRLIEDTAAQVVAWEAA